MTLTVGGLITSYNNPANNNYDTPTNPLLSFSAATTDRRFIAIHQDGSASSPIIEEPVNGAGLLTEYSNLHNTDGFTIRCFNNQDSIGINLSTMDLANHNYYVLIHSDNENMYHFAKITEKLTADISGDKFKFSPRLGNEIAKGTKFMVFKEANPVSNIVAISGGLKLEDRKLVVARPLFYFFEDKLDRKGELDHNTKYFINTQHTSSGSSVTLNNAEKTTFVTISDYRNKIIDYSKFSMNLTLVDRLKIKDDPDTATSNENNLLSSTYNTLTDYNSCFVNARRDANDDPSSLLFTGNKRYVYYNYSPENNNYMPLVYHCQVKDTFDVKSGFATLELIDSAKSLSSKVFDTDRLSVTQKLSEEDLNEFIEIGTVSLYQFGLGLHLLTMEGKYPNASNLMGTEVEVKINDRIWIGTGAGAGVFILDSYSKTLTGSSFDNSVNPNTIAMGSSIFVRRLNPTNKSVVTDTQFAASKVGKLSINMVSNEYKNFYCDILGMPAINQFSNLTDNDFSLALSFNTNTSIDGIEYLTGSYVLNYEVFFGSVEVIEKKITNSMSVFTIEGRNTLSKLVDITIDKETRFLSDIIQTSESPHNRLTNVGQTATWDFDSTTITFGANVTISANAHLWGSDGYIGQLNDSGISGANTGTLLENPLTKGTNDNIYYESSKYYPLSKASAANKEINSVSSLSGTSDKGFHFTGGNSFTGNTLTLTEGSALVGTSNETNPLSVGYNIDIIESIDEDLPFMLDINGFNSDTVNALMDFTVIDVKDKNDTKTVKLAPYVPLTLAREEINELDTSDGSFTSLGNILGSSTGYHFLVNYVSVTPTVRTALFSLNIGDSIYINGVFAGKLLEYKDAYDTTNNQFSHTRMKLDRSITPITTGYTASDLLPLSTSNGKKNRSLHLTNGAHLHSNQTINLIGPNRLPINYEIDSNFYGSAVTENTYSKKYGASIYKIFNLEFGKIGYRKDYLVLESSNGIGRLQPYYGEGNFSYFAQAYRGNADIGLVLSGKTGTTNNNHTPLEQRGHEPITGSNYIDRKFVSSNVTVNKLLPYTPEQGTLHLGLTPSTTNPLDNPIIHKDKFYQPDAKAARLFLYGTCDKRLYSSDRKDSLLQAGISIESYGLLGINNSITTNSSAPKSNTVGGTSRVTQLDQDYTNSAIISSSKTLSNLKRFGLMRLTDVVMDFAYNIINPEYDVPSSKVVESFKIMLTQSERVQGGGNDRTVISAGESSSIVFNASIDNILLYDFLFDETTRRPLGLVSGLSQTNVPNDTIDLLSTTPPIPATRDGGNNNNYIEIGNTVGVIRREYNNPVNNNRWKNDIVSVIGRGQQETLLYGYKPTQNHLTDDKEDIHLLKGLFAGKDAPTDWVNFYRDTSDGNNSSESNTSIHLNLRKGENNGYMTVILPFALETLSFSHPTDEGHFDPDRQGLINFESSIGAGSNGTEYDQWEVSKRTGLNIEQSEIFTFMQQLYVNDVGSPSSSHSRALLKAVNLKPYSTESDTISKQGQTSPFLDKAIIGNVFKSFNDVEDNHDGNFYQYMAYTTASEYGVSDTDTAGVYLGFKPHVMLTSVSNSAVKSIKGTTLYKNSMTLTQANQIMKNLDLTGCYLVPAKKGTYYEGEGTRSNSSVLSNHELTPHDNKIIYVVSHEYNLANTGTDDTCILLTDESLEANVLYKVMQPNPVCFWDKSPEKIRLNTLSCEYTKSMGSDEMLKSPSAWTKKPTVVGTRDDESNSEGVQSMYVIVDMDNLSGENNTIVKTKTGLSTILTGIDGEFCISDGNDNVVTTVKSEVINDNIGRYLTIPKIKKLNGVVSVSETFDLRVNGDITNEAKRALIGTTIDISKEVEETIEELLIENDIDFTFTKEDYSIFTSPNFQGNNLFEVLKYLLGLKDKKLTNSSGTINIVSYDDSQFVSKYYFTDDDIVQLETEKSQFGYYNEITLYGNKHKAVRKSPREIKKRGKKSLNVFDEKLTTQNAVDEEASRLLKQHLSIEDIVSINVESSKVKTISVGDTVEVESKAAGLERKLYLVLEMTHKYDGQINFKLGTYIEGLEDTLAKLIISSQDTKSYLRKKEFNVNENAFDFFDDINIKEMHLLIRKRHQSGSSLGFTTTLNTNTNPLGFSGGVVTITKLLEEDL